MGTEEQALTVRNEGALVPKEDPQEAQERRLEEVRCSLDPATAGVQSLKPLPRARQRAAVVQAEEHDAKLRHIMDTVPINIKHLQGSSAGAGSGEFHIYRKVCSQQVVNQRAVAPCSQQEQPGIFSCIHAQLYHV